MTKLTKFVCVYFFPTYILGHFTYVINTIIFSKIYFKIQKTNKKHLILLPLKVHFVIIWNLKV